MMKERTCKAFPSEDMNQESVREAGIHRLGQALASADDLIQSLAADAKEKAPGQNDSLCPDTRLQELDKLLWDTLCLFQEVPFYTAKNLEFFYTIKGYEMFVSRKDKSITRSTVLLTFHNALKMNRKASGPKALGTFGASYLYPIFQKIGVLI